MIFPKLKIGERRRSRNLQENHRGPVLLVGISGAAKDCFLGGLAAVNVSERICTLKSVRHSEPPPDYSASPSSMYSAGIPKHDGQEEHLDSRSVQSSLGGYCFADSISSNTAALGTDLQVSLWKIQLCLFLFILFSKCNNYKAIKNSCKNITYWHCFL